MTELRRPDPDQLLRLAKQEEAAAARGRLKVFFGASPGVGKTFAMLEEARARKAEGLDVVVGVVETHGRRETEALLTDLQVLARRTVEHRGVTLTEFDLDAALARHPRILLVDELAHTNAPGSRHAKRWQDVDELLDAGIDVYTTLNVQHVESLNDVVAQITGIQVRETIPDAILDRADQIELADLSPDDLLRRLREGKVYVPEQASRAIERFFRKGNLIALRELALRRTAQRVDEQMRGYMQAHGIREVWPASDRILVCLGAGAEGPRLVRAARRMATVLRCEWVALHVEALAPGGLNDAEREQLTATMQLAEQLGAQAVTVSGHSVRDEILAYAQAHNVTRILVGKPRTRRWRHLLRGSLVDGLVRQSGPTDIYVLSGTAEEGTPQPPARRRPRPRASEFLIALGTVALCTALNWFVFRRINVTDVAMVYLLGTILVAARTSLWPSVVASVTSIALFDFLFVPPFGTFAVNDVDYIATFAVMLAVSLVTSYLTLQVRGQARAAREREQRTGALYALSRELAGATATEVLTTAARRHVDGALGVHSFILLPGPDRGLSVPHLGVPDGAGQPLLDDRELSVARWVYDHGSPAGRGTDTLPASRGLYLPLTGGSGAVGVLAIFADDTRDLQHPTARQLLEAFAGQTALALERVLLATRHQESQMEVEAERLRTALLSSLSHDLRTPLGAITGAASTLRDDAETISASARDELLGAILQESARMNRLIGNLLDMIRLETGALQVQPDFQPLEEVVGVALIRLEERLQEHPVTTALPADLPLVAIDGILIEQVLVNLLENAAKYTPAGTPIEISAEGDDEFVTVSVADRGPGIPPGEEQKIFDKFHRLPTVESPSGVGLGLTICRGIVTAHGGRIWAENRQGGGLAVRFTLPVGRPDGERGERGETEGMAAALQGSTAGRPETPVAPVAPLAPLPPTTPR